MRRGIALFAAAGLSLTLAACGDDSSDDKTNGGGGESTTDGGEGGETTADGGNGGDADGDVSLTVWVDSNREAAVKDAASAYEEATGNSVDVVVKEFDDIRQEFQTQVPTGEGPDITVGAHDWLGEFHANGVVAPVELGDFADDFTTVAVEAFTYEGQVYGLPYAIENLALFRNTELASEAPATYEDMVAAGKDAGTPYPFLIQTGEEGDPYTYYPFQTSFGAPVFVQNDDGTYSTELGLGGENGQAYAEWLIAEGEAGNLDTNITYDVAIDAFSKGESPFIVGGPWMIQEFADAGLDLAVDPIPAPGPEPAQPFVGVQGFYISAEAANPIAANDFLLNYIGTEEAQTAIYEAGNRLPALTAAADAVSGDEMTAGFAAVAEDAVPMPSIPQMGEVWQFWGVTEAKLIRGEAGVDAWDKMVSDIEAAIQ